MTKSVVMEGFQSGYGKLKTNSHFKVYNKGYYSIVGENSAGKSSILQYIFTHHGNSIYIWNNRSSILDGERDDGGRLLGQVITEIKSKMQNPQRPTDSNEQFEIQKNYNNVFNQLLMSAIGGSKIHGSIRAELEELCGFSINVQDRKLIFGSNYLSMEGSGYRSLLQIVLAVNSEYTMICIDEPEEALEPKLQKRLKEYLIRKSVDKAIYVATHSHLFIDKDNKNSIITVSNGDVLGEIGSNEDLVKIIFNLLGSSPSDILLPNSIIIVEGLADKIFLEKIIELKGYKDIGIHYADGDNKIEDAAKGIDQMLKPLAGYAPIYRSKTCVLFDKPVKTQQETYVTQVKEFLGHTDEDKKVFLLERNAIEFFYPRHILNEILGVTISETDIENYINPSSYNHGNGGGNIGGKIILKANLASQVSERLTQEDLEGINPIILEVINKALQISKSRN